MAVRIFPCYGCPLGKGCTWRHELSSRVRNLGMRAAAFPCPVLEREMRPGRRVEIIQPLGRRCWDGGITVFRHKVPGTIYTVQNHYRASVIVDSDGIPVGDDDDIVDDKFRFRKTMPHTRIIRFLDEPDRPVCKSGRILLPDGTCDRRADDHCQCKDGWFHDA